MRTCFVLLVALTACTPKLAELAKFPDAPLQLRDDSDRQDATDSLWLMPAGPARDAARAAIADALAHRLDDALEEDEPIAAEGLASELASLWQDDPDAVGRGLAAYAPLLHRLRDTFARSGALEPTLAILAILAEVEPAQRDAALGEIDEILEFAGSVAASSAIDAAHERPSALLQPAVLVLPLPWLVDRYVAVLEQRQKAMSDQLANGHAPELAGALHEVSLTARRIAAAYARAGRIDQIAPHLAKLAGLGEDGTLKDVAEQLVRAPTAAGYVALARMLRSDEHGQIPDPAAAFAACRLGLARFPHDAQLLAAAASAAAALGRIEQPIALDRAAIAAGAVDAVTAARLGRLIAEHVGRLAVGGRPGAAWSEWHALGELAARERDRGHAPAAWAQALALAESALGRGLLGQGRIHEAEVALTGSLDHAPSVDAYEALTVLYFKTSRLGPASHTATAGLAMLGDSSADQYRRAKLERIAGDVMRIAGRSRDATALYLDSVRTWALLGDDRALPRPIAAERKLEFARGMWYLGSSDKAVDLALEATELAPEVGTTTVDTVAFLLEVGRSADAADAAHRGLASPELGELDKVYISLWVLADARRRGDARDRLCWEYLASRHGDLWYELLAEAASGRLDWTALTAAATTAPRQAELAFYGASLGLDPEARDPAAARKLLERAVDAHLVMDAEYDLARQYLMMP